MKKYVNSKFKIFSNQNKHDFALLNNIKFTNIYKKKKFKGKLKFVSIIVGTLYLARGKFPAGLEPDPAPRKAESWEGNRKHST